MNKFFKMGFSYGLIAPLVVLYLYILIYMKISLDSALDIFNKTNTLSHHISLCVFASNLILFFLFIRLKKDDVAKGILASTFVYTIIVIYLKFLR